MRFRVCLRAGRAGAANGPKLSLRERERAESAPNVCSARSQRKSASVSHCFRDPRLACLTLRPCTRSCCLSAALSPNFSDPVHARQTSAAVHMPNAHLQQMQQGCAPLAKLRTPARALCPCGSQVRGGAHRPPPWLHKSPSKVKIHCSIYLPGVKSFLKNDMPTCFAIDLPLFLL